MLPRKTLQNVQPPGPATKVNHVKFKNWAIECGRRSNIKKGTRSKIE
jgi:hypothetical protein